MGGVHKSITETERVRMRNASVANEPSVSIGDDARNTLHLSRGGSEVALQLGQPMAAGRRVARLHHPTGLVFRPQNVAVRPAREMSRPGPGPGLGCNAADKKQEINKRGEHDDALQNCQ